MLEELEEKEAALYEQVEIDRSAIAIKAKRPLFAWLSSLDPNDPISETTETEATLYLIKDLMDQAEIEAWLKKNFHKIFLKELSAWHLIIDDYPRQFSFKMFKEWFDYTIHPMVVDLEEDDITKLD